MVDVVDAATRSRMMASIKGRDTRPEIALRRALHVRGLRFRLHAKHLPGRPDLVLPKWNALVYVHGCFWHRHPGCRFATRPATRPEFWENKFAGNVARDLRNLSAAEAAGWRTCVVWECALKASGIESVADGVVSWLRSGGRIVEFGAEQSQR